MTDDQPSQPPDPQENARLREMEILAQVEAEESGAPRAPVDLLLLMLAPLFIVVIGLVLFVTLRGRPPQTMTPIGNTTSVPSQTAIVWQYSLDAGQQIARSTNKKLMVDFYADW